MKKEIYKRVKKAAVSYAQAQRPEWMPKDCYSADIEDGFVAGARFGYEQAMKQKKDMINEEKKKWIEKYKKKVKKEYGNK